MHEPFPITDIPDGVLSRQEPMGTKDKFWYEDKALGRCLFKIGHENSGEDWAEVVSAEICRLIALPFANYQFAAWQGRRGVISRSFLSPMDTLVPGNEVLYQLDQDYPVGQRFRVQKHNIEGIYSCFKPLQVRMPIEPAPTDIVTAQQVFLGYLMLDAWIGNTDRHHQNWALIQRTEDGEQFLRLAPTHDHAASLGCTLKDEEVVERLHTKDKGRTVRAFAESEKARSAIFQHETDQKPLVLIEAFRLASVINPEASNIWLTKLENVSPAEIDTIFARIPDHLISAGAKQFAIALLGINRDRLLTLK